MKACELNDTAILFAAILFSLAPLSVVAAGDGRVGGEMGRGEISGPANIPMSVPLWDSWRAGITNFVTSDKFDPVRFAKLLPEAASLDSNFLQGRYLAWYLAQNSDVFKRTGSFLSRNGFEPEDLLASGAAGNAFYDTVAKTRKVVRSVVAYHQGVVEGNAATSDSIPHNRKMLGNWGSAFPYFFETNEREQIEKLSRRRIWTHNEAKAVTENIAGETEAASKSLRGTERVPASLLAHDQKHAPPVATDAGSRPGAAPLTLVLLSHPDPAKTAGKRSVDEQLKAQREFLVVNLNLNDEILESLDLSRRPDFLKNWPTAEQVIIYDFLHLELIRAIKDVEKKLNDTAFRELSEEKRWEAFKSNLNRNLFSNRAVDEFLHHEKGKAIIARAPKLIKDKDGIKYLVYLFSAVGRAIINGTASNKNLSEDLKQWMINNRVLEEPLFTTSRPTFDSGMPGLGPGIGGGIGPGISDPYADIP